MSIKLITLKNNQTLICNITDQSKESVTFKESLLIIAQNTKDGPMMGFSPFLDFSQEFKTGITISKDDVLCINSPATELENEYNKIFGSGITIASTIPKL